eukprot:CAMPEP_0170444572 /NCGR_PEP_ID=MMETSP0117_2-20130122/48601_1 /TAXON_ID=400756 /ORGANISM="Durinskia baltica, Strain CSIRO CS-38" /LENGTH=54 /DNA_ID=CAMNT_0010705393 /DNA_START=13 /DNA_END=174 /DNA_ORIENTATION=-
MAHQNTTGTVQPACGGENRDGRDGSCDLYTTAGCQSGLLTSPVAGSPPPAACAS